MEFYPAISYGITESGVNVGRINSLLRDGDGWRSLVVWDTDDQFDYQIELREAVAAGFGPKAIHAITDQGQIAGCFKFFTKADRLYAKGTYVWPQWRKEGAGKFLWRTAIDIFNPRVIKVAVVSDLGKTLVNALQRDYPNVRFKMVEYGNRKLRVLRR